MTSKTERVVQSIERLAGAVERLARAFMELADTARNNDRREQSEHERWAAERAAERAAEGRPDV